MDDTVYADSEFDEPGDYYYRVYVMEEHGRMGGSNLTSYHLPPSILKVTIHYTGSSAVSDVRQLYVGLFDDPKWPDFGDDGTLKANKTSLDMVLDDPDSFHHYILAGSEEPQDTYGPFYVAAFLDVTGGFGGSSILPPGCPAVIFDHVNPFGEAAGAGSTPIYVNRGETTEITLDFDDSYLVPEG